MVKDVEKLKKIIRKCSLKEEVSEKEQKLYRSVMTVPLKDGEYTFDCFYERVFFDKWLQGDKPSYHLFITTLKGLKQQGVVDDSDLNYILTEKRAEKVIEKFSDAGCFGLYPTAAKMDRSYALFCDFSRKGYIKGVEKPNTTAQTGEDYHSFYKVFDDNNGVLNIDVYKQIVKNDRSYTKPSVDYVKYKYKSYIAMKGIQLPIEDLYALDLDVPCWESNVKLEVFEPFLGRAEPRWKGEYLYCQKASTAYYAVKVLGLSNLSLIGDGSVHNSEFWNDVLFSVVDQRSGEVVEGKYRPKNVKTMGRFKLKDSLNEWVCYGEDFPTMLLNAAVNMSPEDYTKYKGKLRAYCDMHLRNLFWYVWQIVLTMPSGLRANTAKEELEFYLYTFKKFGVGAIFKPLYNNPWYTEDKPYDVTTAWIVSGINWWK